MMIIIKEQKGYNYPENLIRPKNQKAKQKLPALQKK